MPGMTRVLRLDDRSCVFATPERPPHAILAVSARGIHAPRKGTPGIVETAVEVALAGRPIATYVAGAYAWRLPLFPWLFVGCVLIDQPPAWQCGAQFDRTLTKIGRVEDFESEKFLFPFAADILGVGKLPRSDGHVAPSPTDDLNTLLVKLPKIPELASSELGRSAPANDRELFVAFAAFLASDDYVTMKSGAWTILVVDGADGPSRELMDAATRDPGRLGPLRDQMIAKLGAMRAHGISQVSPWVKLVASALTTMSRRDFVAMPNNSLNTLLQYLSDTEAWRYGGLYVRTADVGKRALAFYSADFARYKRFWPQGENPALAICRIGEADEAVLQALRAEYLKFLPGDPNRKNFRVKRYRSALFLALLATGDEQFLRDNPANGADAMEGDWLRLLLDRRGRVDGIPNNCHVIDRLPIRNNDPLGPVLTWSGQHWQTVAAGSH